MTRAPLAPITVALDPGVAAWSLQRQARAAADALGEPAPGVRMAVTRPFQPRDGIGLSRIRSAIAESVPEGPWLEYRIDGFIGRHGTVGLRLDPADALAAAAAEIESALSAIAAPAALPDERFMVPIARGLDRRRRRDAMAALGLTRPPWYRRILGPRGRPALCPPLQPHDATRLLVLAGDAPAAAYDLPSRHWIARAGLGERSLLRSSLQTYRRARGLEIDGPAPRSRDETWLLADLHLGHPDIMLHAARPFLSSDVAEMDRVLLGNWRATVAPADRAVVAGDLCSDPDCYREALASLPGRLTLVRGNHDPSRPDLLSSAGFIAGGQRFVVVHDPADAPPGFDGWVIHGHVHDSDLRRFPFFDPATRRVNVSAETAGYRPVPLSLVCALIAAGSGPVLLRRAALEPLTRVGDASTSP